MMKRFLAHRMVSIVSGLAVLFAAGGFAWAYFALRGAAGGPLILHFNDLQGITLVGGLGDIIAMGSFGVVVTIINFFLALELDDRDAFLGKLFSVLTLIFAVLLFIAFAAILNVN